MIIRKILLATGVAALMSTPAWAVPGKGAEHNGGHHGKHGSGQSDNPTTGKDGNPGRSHRCTPHRVGYVAAGMLVSDTLTKNADGTYSGTLVVKVTHTNHHAAADNEKEVTYTLTNARLTFAVSDVNKDGSVGTDDLVAGDRTHLTGRITRLHHNCNQTEFKATTTIGHVVFHEPKPPVSKP